MSKKKIACITLDLESDYAGHAPVVYDAWEKEYTDEFLGVLQSYRLPLSVFVVGNTLGKFSSVIRRFEKYGCEFHLHSFSHDMVYPDSEHEIVQGKRVFKKYFGYSPKGYRAPEGRISDRGLKLLSDNGFCFDASVFPSFWPRLRYATFPRQPYIHRGSNVIEIPFTTVGPMRLIFSLSWVKLLGFDTYVRLVHTFDLPDIVVFNLHLHDLWTLPAYELLNSRWKRVYGRNSAMGMKYMRKSIELLHDKGYTFSTVNDVVGQILQ